MIKRENVKWGIQLLVLSIVVIMGCKQDTAVVSKAVPAEEAGLYPHGPLWGAMWQQRSAEYKALCFQAFYTAQFRLDQLLKQKYKRPVAIVTDIDETVLDNSPYYVKQALKGALYSDSSWMEWTALNDCDTVPGALAFLKYASQRGVKIFYITNRLEAERKVTLDNLKKWGFPDATDPHITLKKEVSSKDSRRKEVAKDHEILLLLGDNLGDFATFFDKQTYERRDSLVVNEAANFGSRFIVLPNPMYGDWEEVLFEYKNALSVEEKNKAFRKTVRSF